MLRSSLISMLVASSFSIACKARRAADSRAKSDPVILGQGSYPTQGIPVTIYTSQNRVFKNLNVGTHTWSDLGSKMPGQWTPGQGWAPVQVTPEQSMQAALARGKNVVSRTIYVTPEGYNQLQSHVYNSGPWRPFAANCFQEVAGPGGMPYRPFAGGARTLDGVERSWGAKGYLANGARLTDVSAETPDLLPLDNAAFIAVSSAPSASELAVKGVTLWLQDARESDSCYDESQSE